MRLPFRAKNFWNERLQKNFAGRIFNEYFKVHGIGGLIENVDPLRTMRTAGAARKPQMFKSYLDKSIVERNFKLWGICCNTFELSSSMK